MAKGLTSKLSQFALKSLPGMNSKFEEEELGQSFVSIAQNTRYENEPGAVIKRSPISYFNNTSSGTGGVKSLHRYYTSTGVKKWVKIHGTTARVGDDAAGTFTTIRSSLTDGKKSSFVTFLGSALSKFESVW